MIEFGTGMLVGFVVAGLIGRAKFLQVQNKLRQIRDDLFTQAVSLRKQVIEYQQALLRERNLTEGLTQELDAVATKSRIRAA